MSKEYKVITKVMLPVKTGVGLPRKKKKALQKKIWKILSSNLINLKP